VKVSFQDCCRDLLRDGSGAASALQAWQLDPKFQQVVPFVTGFVHDYLFQIDPAAVESVIARSGHALGNVQSTEQLKVIEDFSTPFALHHLFHWCVENHRALPTWEEFADWMTQGEAGPLWHQQLVGRLGPPSGDEQRRKWSRAAKWRLGKFYLSAIREIDVLARLRHAGLELKYHLLADVLFRADFWSGNSLVCLYFPNTTYRAGSDKGRKPPAERFFEGAHPPFDIIHFPVHRQGFGKVWRADNSSIDALLQLIAKSARRT
jgi:hypothetical protein